jgi:hypothetical protein
MEACPSASAKNQCNNVMLMPTHNAVDVRIRWIGMGGMTVRAEATTLRVK